MNWIRTEPGPDSFSSPELLSRSNISQLIDLFGGAEISGLTRTYFSTGWIIFLISLIWCVVVAFGGLTATRTAALVFACAGTAWTIYVCQQLTTRSADGSSASLEVGAILSIAAGVAVIAVGLLSNPWRTSA